MNCLDKHDPCRAATKLPPEMDEKQPTPPGKYPSCIPDFTEDESRIFAELASGKMPRRDFMKVMSATSAGVFGMQMITQEKVAAQAAALPDGLAANSAASLPSVPIRFTVNGTVRQLDLDPRVTLLDALRHKLAMTGTKKGCDHGQCGACTMLVDGQRVNSCLQLAVMKDGAQITTVEGLASADGVLHPLQEAFMQHDAFQCGYCTPGQLCSAVGMLAEGHATTRAEIRELMSGNLCRCGAYVHIVDAIEDVLAKQRSAAL